MRRLLPALILLTGCAHSHHALPALLPPPVAAHGKDWTDQGEYTLADAATKEIDPAVRLAELDRWTAAYPVSGYIDERQDMYLVVYTQLQQGRQAFDRAQQILKFRPNNFRALIATLSQVLAIQPAPTAENLDIAEKVANLFVDDPDKVLAVANKPADMADSDWAQAKNQVVPYAEQILMQVYALRKDDRREANDLTELIHKDRTLGRASYTLGQTMIRIFRAEKRPEAQPLAFYQFARAVAYDGPGRIDARNKQAIQTYLIKAYTAFHGSTDGLDELLATAKTAPFPPPDFTIKSTVDVVLEKAAERNH